MPDVTGAPLEATIEFTVDNDPGADARTDLDEEEALRVPGTPGASLPEGHHVHVVVNKTGNAEMRGDLVTHGVAIPPRHDRRTHNTPEGSIDRPGKPDSDPLERASVVANPVEEIPNDLVCPGENDDRSLRNVDGFGMRREHRRLQVAHRHVDAGDPDLDTHNGPPVRGEPEQATPPGT
jgi:hypothetical protein